MKIRSTNVIHFDYQMGQDEKGVLSKIRTGFN